MSEELLNARIDRLEEESAYLREQVLRLEDAFNEQSKNMLRLTEANRIQELALKKLANREQHGGGPVFDAHNDPVPSSG